ncbi:TetR/AcrR family transcriptional regulator [Desulfuribacillus alkaliarsenatis]|uniref:TetR family transcriptional regulator n=1 Tax=Desulfuribacillus alkaliarsenatis TaxID=766136 RepID=A0A1E5G2A5_9FIRM|nr:TetR/AcrR family transcriptional regulator [Desulfuribacillus alkaliarsenatis]OEF97101.1 TetR family transcriptional regulator [Desulfuribacillus alkaliarsenatis]
MVDIDARDRIIKAAIDILAEVDDVDKITVRQIAERANVGVGLINYHFNSKNKLLSIAVSDYMASMAVSLVTSGNDSETEPIEKLKLMLKELYNFAQQNEKIIRFTITQNLLNGEMQTPVFLIPVLKEIFAEQKDEIQLRIIALQILLPIQVTSLNPKEFYVYSGIDLHEESQRNRYIDTLVDNIVFCND